MNKPTRSRARPLADLIGQTLNNAFARQGFAAVEIVTHWDDIVGRDLAERSEPVRLTWPRREDPDSVGTLTVRVEGAYAIEIQHMAPVLMERVNRYFGWRCVGRLSIRQGPVERRRRSADRAVEPTEEQIAAVGRELGPFEDAGLAGSLARLGALVRKGRGK